MKELLALLRPRLLGFKNTAASASAGSRFLRRLFFAAIGLLFWVGVFVL